MVSVFIKLVVFLWISIIVFLLSFMYLHNKRNCGPKYPILQRCGRHVFYQYKNVCGHLLIESYDADFDMNRIAKQLIVLFNNGITTISIGSVIFKNNGEIILKNS